MPKKPAAPDTIDEMRRAIVALGRLERQVGIADQAAHARDVFVRGDGGGSDAPFGSDAAKHERLRDNQSKNRLVAQRIRAVYFSVADLSARKALIAADRELDAMRHRAASANVFEARGQLQRAIKSSLPSPTAVFIGAAASSAVAYFAYYVYGIGPAFAVLAWLVVMGQMASVAEITARDRAIRRAEGELQQVEEMAEEVYRVDYTFSRREAATGDPD